MDDGCSIGTVEKRVKNLLDFDRRFAKNFSCPTCDSIEEMNILCVHIEEFLVVVRNIYIYMEKDMEKGFEEIGNGRNERSTGF